MKRTIVVAGMLALLALATLLLVGCRTEKLALPFSTMLPECREIEGIGHNQKDTNMTDGGYRRCRGEGHTLAMKVERFDSEMNAEKWMAGERGLSDCGRPADVFLHCRELSSDHLLGGVDEVAEFSLVDYPLKVEEEDEGQDGAATIFIAFRKGVFCGYVEFTDERPVVAREEGKWVDVYELGYTETKLAEEIFGGIRDEIGYRE
jgi:hypothetical protein